MSEGFWLLLSAAPKTLFDSEWWPEIFQIFFHFLRQKTTLQDWFLLRQSFPLLGGSSPKITLSPWFQRNDSHAGGPLKRTYESYPPVMSMWPGTFWENANVWQIFRHLPFKHVYCLDWFHILTPVGSINSFLRISSSHLRWRESLSNGYIHNPILLGRFFPSH